VLPQLAGLRGSRVRTACFLAREVKPVSARSDFFERAGSLSDGPTHAKSATRHRCYTPSHSPHSPKSRYSPVESISVSVMSAAWSSFALALRNPSVNG
jgi:hypothetical protein